MFGLRTKGYSINHISKILGRSTSTVHNWTKSLTVNHDNRKLSPGARTNGVIGFYNAFKSIRLRVTGFVLGLFATWNEAMEAQLVPLNLIDYLVAKQNENSCESEEVEPD